MRDTLRTEFHWENMIKSKSRDIEFSKNMIAKVISEKGEDFGGVKIAYIRQRANYIMMLNTLYSSGASLHETKECFLHIIETFRKSWTKESGYVELIWIIAIAIMLDVPIEIIRELEMIVEREKYRDFLIDFFFHKIDALWNIESESFNAPIPYAGLEKVIKADTKKESASLLMDYLNNEWYQGHDDASWYDNHKDEKSFYSGYWSYESGAIAKILKLDDTGWENLRYYPYDMVHYSDSI